MRVQGGGHLPRQDEPIHDHVLERRFPKEGSGQDQQSVKPENTELREKTRSPTQEKHVHSLAEFLLFDNHIKLWFLY